MASTDTAAKIAAVAAQVQTVGQARAALGKTADVLREAYTKLPEVENVGGSVLGTFDKFFGAIDEARGEGLRVEFRNSLDIVNAYAQGVYAKFAAAQPSTFGDAISWDDARRIGVTLERARSILRDIEDAAATEWWSFAELIVAALAEAGRIVGEGAAVALKGATAAASGLFVALWPYLVVGGAVLLVYLFRRRIVALFGGET